MQVQTNSSFQDTQNPSVPKADSNMSDFIAHAQTFAKNASAEGIGPIGIEEGIKFMYGLTQENIKNQQAMTNTPFQQEQSDIANKGKIIFNKYGDAMNELPGVGLDGKPGSSGGSYPSSSPATYDDPQQTGSSSNSSSGLDPAAFDQVWKPMSSMKSQSPLNLSDIIKGSTSGGPTSFSGLTVNAPSPTGLTIDSQGSAPQQTQNTALNPQQSPMMQGLLGLISPTGKNI